METMCDSTEPTPSRRRVVAAGAVAVLGAVAGCSGSNDGDGSPTADASEPASATTEASETASTATGTSGGSGLDLREANVVGVSVERDGDVYEFDVTLHHDDDGEDGYADWWQVERLDGTRLGRRELLHPHSQQPFTRSATVEIPDGVDCVVVRGHDQTHGYGGRLAVVALASGAVADVDQGPEPQSVDAEACPE
jgi:hypothetical protein